MYKVLTIGVMLIFLLSSQWCVAQTCGAESSTGKPGFFGDVFTGQCGPNSIPSKHRVKSHKKSRVERDGGSKKEVVTKCKIAMRTEGLSEERIKHMQIVSQAPIYLDSPSAIFGQAEKLELSAEQQDKLTIIMSNARREALKVLTQNQRLKLGSVPVLPITMEEICEEMNMEMQRKKHKLSNHQGKIDSKCPLCFDNLENTLKFKQELNK